MIQINDLTISYREQPVLWDIDEEFPSGKLSAIIGPNGAGKSTLLKAILGLVQPLSGQITIQKKSVKEYLGLIAYVPQKGNIDWDFPTTAFDLVLMGTYRSLSWFRRPGKLQKQKTEAALKRVGMWDFRDRQISQLSGGQQQRLFLARALVQDAPIFLLDEPFQGVDIPTEETILSLFQELRNQGKTVIAIHHDLGMVQKYFDWVLMLNVQKIVSGEVSKVFTKENLEKTYASKGDFLILPKLQI